MASVASAGTAAARRPTSVSSTAVSSTPSPSPPSQAGSASPSRPAWPSSFHSAWSGNGGLRSSTWAAAWATACWVSPRVKSTQKLEHVIPAGGQGAARNEPQLGRCW